MYPKDVKYTATHEWARPEGKLVAVGITSYASEQLSDIVYVELPTEGEEATKGSPFGTLESVKAVSDVYSPVSGKIEEVNHRLQDEPELLNKDPYGEGWIIKISPTKKEDLEDLMDAAAYEKFVEEQEEVEE
jgi:glycine cleavage system H protein